MKKVLAISTLLLGALSVSACNSNSNNSTSLTATDLQHHRFVLTELNGKAVTSQSQPFLEVGENLAITGKMCNNFFGKAELTKNTIKSTNLAMTRMMCADSQLNQLDGIINQVFTNGATVSLHDNVLQLTDGQNTLTFSQKDLM